MKVNTLVTHKKLKSLGIGCVSKTLSKSVKVNFGRDSVKTCNPQMLKELDVSKCKTITFREYKNTILNAKTKHSFVIVGNELRHYVGIGWTFQRVITLNDLDKHPRVID